MEPPEPERRQEARAKVSLPVTLITGATRSAGTCLDLSNEGLLVEMAADDTPGAEGELHRVEVEFPDGDRIVLTVVITRRVERKMGLLLFGVSGESHRAWRAKVADRLRRAGLGGPALRR